MPMTDAKPAPERLAAEAPNPVRGGVFTRNPTTGELTPVVPVPAAAPAANTPKE